MTKTYTIRPLPYSNFTNREFESLMTDSHQVLTSFAKSYKDEAMYDDHLEVFDSKLEQFQAQLASVENKQTLSLAEVDKERDSALVGLFTLHRGFAKIKEPNLKAAHETLTPVLAKYKDITAQEGYDRAEALARAAKSSKEVGKTKQLRTELSRIYDLFMRYTAASAEAYPEKLHFAKLLKDLNTIRDSKRRLSSPSKKTKMEPAVEVAG